MITDEELLQIWLERYPLKETKQLLDILGVGFSIDKIKLLRFLASELPPVYAAAPELLQAVKHMLSLFRDAPRGGPADDCPVVWSADHEDELSAKITFATKAVAKAEGESC